MGEKDDGLGLSLSLGCAARNEPSLRLNHMPLSSSQSMQNHHKRSPWTELFHSSDRNSDTRSFLRGIDVNQAPTVADCEEENGVSSPNSTVSSISGKRSEREPIGDETEAERASCSRGSDDEDGGAGDASRKKLRLSKEQSLLLEETFKEHSTLNPKQKLALAKQLNLRPRQVEVWFQNRRARTKLKQTEVDCEYLKRCCENLTEENRRLQKEVQELRSLKLSPQLYMNMNPPTTLTCASSCRSRNSFSPSRAYSEDDNRKENNSEEHNNKLTAPSFRRLLALNIPEWKQASLGCLSAVLFGAVQPVYAFAMGSMISVYFLKDHDEIKEKTRFYSLCFFGLSIFSFLTNVCQQYYFAYMGEYLTKRIRENMLSKILTFEVGWFDQDENSSGAICSRLAKDANVVRSLVGDRVALLVQTFSSITIAFTMSLIISWRLALVIIAVQPLVIVCLYGKEVLLKSMSKKVIKAQDESSKLAAEAVSNLRTINAFSSQERIQKMLKKAQEAPRREGVRQSWIAGICLAFSRALVSCVVALAFWYGGRLVGRGYIDGKSLFEIFLVLVSTGKVIADAGTMTTDIAKGSDAVASVFAVLDRHTKIDPDDLNGYQPEKIIGHIELEDVHFAYPARPNVMIFKGFSINIEAKKSTALVGQSGSGKSTIIGLIERFYDPLKGVVKIDGRDIRSHHLGSLRRHIALVSQEPALFAGTIRENITYGASDKIDESEIIEAAKAANAHDFIAGLYEGYDTWCGDRGLQLSGGQKQRIAIARAILKNPAVLLLDEATSALDSQSEKVVQEALERLMVERTSVVVAHRLSTIQNCDIIAVLEQGRVVEEGSHQSLLAKGPAGAYYSLVSLQTTPQN